MICFDWADRVGLCPRVATSPHERADRISYISRTNVDCHQPVGAHVSSPPFDRYLYQLASNPLNLSHPPLIPYPIVSSAPSLRIYLAYDLFLLCFCSSIVYDVRQVCRHCSWRRRPVRPGQCSGHRYRYHGEQNRGESKKLPS